MPAIITADLPIMSSVVARTLDDYVQEIASN